MEKGDFIFESDDSSDVKFREEFEEESCQELIKRAENENIKKEKGNKQSTKNMLSAIRRLIQDYFEEKFVKENEELKVFLASKINRNAYEKLFKSE